MLSSTSFESQTVISGQKIFKMYPDDLQRCETAESAIIPCWHPLFPCRVIAHGFPIRNRKEGNGLELSFENMIAASRCLTLTPYDNGLLAHGLSAILIPMQDLKEDDAIQWHYEDKQKQQFNKSARSSQIFSNLPALQNWYKELKAERLIQRRCFLGLAERANVVIGTMHYQREFSWSGAARSPTETNIRSLSLTLGSGFMGFFTGEGTYTLKPTSVRSVVRTFQEKDIHFALDSGKEHLALLFDVNKNTGWYIPKASVALQMTHALIFRYGYRIFDGALEISRDNPLGFAKPGPDAATEASDAVKKSLRLKIRTPKSGSSEPHKEGFADMFQKVWHTLTDVEIGLEEAESDLRKAKYIAPKYINGVEFIDALNMEASIRIKTVQVGQPWAHLTSEQPLVIFSKDIQPPIIPNISGLCQSWKIVPPQQKYLVSMGHAVLSFLERRNEGLAAGLDWNTRRELVQFHALGKNLPVSHTQKLIARKKPRSNSPIRKMISQHRNGCFVFGPDGENQCTDTLAPVGSAPDEPQVANPTAAAIDISQCDLSASPLVSQSIVVQIHNSLGNDNVVTPICQSKDLVVPSKLSNVSEEQRSAAIRLNNDDCDSESSLYVVSGSARFKDHTPRSYRDIGQIKRKAVASFRNVVSIDQQKTSAGNSSKEIGKGMTLVSECGNGSDHELDDLYDA